MVGGAVSLCLMQNLNQRESALVFAWSAKCGLEYKIR
jgi:hypothetical protein